MIRLESNPQPLPSQIRVAGRAQVNLPRDPVSEAFRNGLAVLPGIEEQLRNALHHVLEHPGSLVRARLAYSVAGRYGLPEQQAEHIAVAVEFFHTASLLFDDLPAMDDANERRGTPCTHRLFGEATAILAALALVNRAYALLWKAMEKAPLQAHRSAASRLVEQCLGVEGILDGQSRDLRGGAEPPTLRDTLRVSVGKTVSLIRLTLLLPALLGGAPADERFLLRRLAVYWGLAYQILDDLKDLFLPSSEIGKTASRDALLSRPNAALAGGLARTGRLVARLTERSARVVGAFTARSPGWAFLADVQSRLQRELPEPLALPGHIFA